MLSYHVPSCLCTAICENSPSLYYKHPSVNDCSGRVSAFEIVLLAICTERGAKAPALSTYIHTIAGKKRRLNLGVLHDILLVTPGFPSGYMLANQLDVLCRYQSRGLFFDPPTCGLSHGRWQVQLPRDLQDHAQHQAHKLQTAFDTREELFSNREDMQKMYAAYIARGIEQYEHADGTGSDKGGAPRRIASCIMEPVIQVMRPL